MVDRRMWWGATAVLCGLGGALLVGSGIAAADSGDSGASTNSAQSESADTSMPDSAGSAAKLRQSRAVSTLNRTRADQTDSADTPTDATSTTADDESATEGFSPAARTPTTPGTHQPSRSKTLPRATSTIDPEIEDPAIEDPAIEDPAIQDIADDPVLSQADRPESALPTTDVGPADTSLDGQTTVAEQIAEPELSESPSPTNPAAVITQSTVPQVATTKTEQTPNLTSTAPPSVTAPEVTPPASRKAEPPVEETQLVTAMRGLAAPVANAPPAAEDAQPDPVLQTAQQSSGPLLPGSSNGVTGVEVGHSRLEIPVGQHGYSARADWYFPTQTDGDVQAQGVIWLQHGFGLNKSFYSSLATELAQQTNSIVVTPTIRSLPSLFCKGCFLSGAEMQQAAATMFLGDQTALNASAAAAGYQGTLPTTFLLSGHSAGGGFSTAVGADTVENGAAADRLRGVVMFDGVSTGALGSGDGFAQQLAELDTLSIPVYQIAAPAQIWNAFGATTDALLKARPDQFDGVVLVDGSHVDSILGPNPIVNFFLQLVTRPVPAGDTAATYTLSTGWMNDLYVGATPEDPEFGFYAGPNQQIIMGDAAAVGLPSPFANQLSPLDALLKSVFDWFGGPFSTPAATSNARAASNVTSVVTPPMTNGVTGVKTGNSVLNIPCGNACAVHTDWYFPTQPDGTVQANGVIWLQHGFLGHNGWYSDLATQIAHQTNSIVAAPNISSFPSIFCDGCFLNGTQMQEAAASMFLGDRAALNISANAAGFQGTLPENFLLTGHSAGGNFATTVGGYTVDNGAAQNLLGVVMFDGVSDSEQFTASLAALDSLGIPDYQIAAPPQPWNAWGGTTELISTLHPDQFTGVMIDDGSHTDSLGGNWLADLASALLVKPSPPGGKAAVSTFTTGWINDIYAGNGPTDPVYGIYGNPNDGTYVANRPIVMGQAGATTLPAPPPVDIDSYLGTWYELGSVKLPFEWFLVNTKAQYSLNPDGSVHVQNSGNYFGPNGPKGTIVGSAVPVNDYNTRLNVSFFLPPLGNHEPGNYWILDYAPDYSWAIVSDPTHFSGYILSRGQTSTEAEYEALVHRARQLGVWGPITPTPQYPA